MWDPGLYRQFGAERSRPFFDLIGRIGAAEPSFVADIGCGPGNLTAELCRRWPAAEVLGVDSSPEMIAEARVLAAGHCSGEGGSRLTFELADATAWEPARPVDVLVSNAMLQWIPDHEGLVVRWLDLLADGGWLAFQLPGNDDQPPHRLIRQLAGSPRWRPLLGEVKLNKQASDPAAYIDLLARAGFSVEAWETTYGHVLEGDNPVLRWYIGTGLRPVIATLDADQQAEFLAEYAALLREAYPRAPYGTIFPFRRVFAVAHRA